MGLDYLASTTDSARRIAAAARQQPDAAIPWSDSWTVAACAQHVGTILHWVTAVIDGRPTAGFDVRGDVQAPDVGSPDLPDWLEAGAAAVTGRFADLGPDEPCWSWWPDVQTVGFWIRRVALELVVHRWDVELGAGITGDPMPPAIAADAIDELLEVFVGMSRALRQAPGAGETVHVHCTDTDGEWLLRFTDGGGSDLTREHAKGDLALRGPAEGLLLHLWGRGPADQFGVEVLGDTALHARWPELVPSL